jgi:manganese-dependent ADP-ribose/CDP-alcohol diphosphatase
MKSPVHQAYGIRFLCFWIAWLGAGATSSAAPAAPTTADSQGSASPTASAPANLAADAAPLFRFGLFADVQYADKDPSGKRQYRQSLGKLERCITALNQEQLAFAVNLGDLIDGHGTNSLAEFQRVTQLFEPLRAPLYHVIGNHCLEIERPAAMRLLKMNGGYYTFTVHGWRMVILDGMDVSVKSPKDSPDWLKAQEYLTANTNLPTYNGALGARQLQWLKETLNQADRERQKVLVLCHHPILAAASDRSHLLWNAAEVLSIIEASKGVVAFICGHDHRGGYAQQKGIHHLTLPGIVEAPEGKDCFAVIEVSDDRLKVAGGGTVPSRVLPIRHF